MRKLINMLKFRIVPLSLLVVIFLMSSLLLTSYTGALQNPDNSFSAATADFHMSYDPTVTSLPIITDSPCIPATTKPVPTPAPLVSPKPTLTPEPTPPPTPEPTPSFRFVNASGEPVYDYYYGLPAPKSSAVDDSYFSDAVFLGDSRTEGFKLYSGLKTADIFAARSINVVNILTDRVILTENDEYITILEACARKTYSKVYIMLGINEIGYEPDYYYERYSEVISRIQEIQPNADIYIQAIIPVSQAKNDDESGFTNEKISLFNSKLLELCVKTEAFYIDTYSALLDEYGHLPSDASFDGIHLYSEYCVAWLDYLKAHTIETFIG